jgi:PAS domain S-box-containing protein
VAPPVQRRETGRTRPQSREGDWSRLFSSAFKNSRNAMVLLDAARRHVDFNGAYLKLTGYQPSQLLGRPVYEFVVGGPVMSEREWQAALARGDFTAEGEMIRSDGTTVAAQVAATAEIVTGRRLVLFVALNTSRWGRRFRRFTPADEKPQQLSQREREIVRLIALGCTSPEISEELGIAHETVRTHARNAMTKVGARSRAHLVARALGAGLIFE